MEFDRRRRHPVLELFDPVGDVDGFDRAQMGDAVGLRPGVEAGRGPGVGAAAVRVPDMGGEELDDAALGVGIRSQQRREPARPDPLRRYGGGGGRSGGRGAGPGIGQEPFYMYDKVLYRS